MKIKITGIIALVVFLFIFRFFDYCILWNHMNADIGNELSFNLEKELTMNNQKNEGINSPTHIHPNFYLLGFNSERNALKSLTKLINAKKYQSIIIVSYFNLFHPLVFLIHNKGERIITPNLFINELDNGITKVSIYKSEKAVIKRGLASKEVIVAVLGEETIWSEKKNNTEGGINATFHEEWTTRSYIGIIFFLYFYIPLLFILGVALIKNTSVFVSSIYFAEMSMLFGAKSFFSNSQFFLQGTVQKFLVIFWIIAICVLFILGIIKTIKDIKEKKIEFKEVLVIFFFVLLPLVLKY